MITDNSDQIALRQHNTDWLESLKGLYSPTKPGIVGLTLVAALTGIFVATRGNFSDWIMAAWLMATLAFATAGSCLLNNVYDQDIDRLMKRTARRALPSGRGNPRLALWGGLACAILPLFVMSATVNLPAAMVTACAVFGYVVVYSMIAKRRTPWANQLGGIAGALPPVIGYVAVSGRLDGYVLMLFMIMVIWQQPHALSLALKYREDYARAGVPVIPVARGIRATKRRIVIYTALLFPTVVSPYIYGMSGDIYLITALVMTAVFLFKAVRLYRSDRDYDMRLFLFSIIYLIVVFAALVIDINPVAAV